MVKLDLELARLSKGQAEDRDTYREYSTKLHKITKLEEECEKGAQYVATLDSACTVLALSLGEAALQTTLLQDLQAEAVRAHDYVESVVCVRINVSAIVLVYTRYLHNTDKDHTKTTGGV